MIVKYIFETLPKINLETNLQKIYSEDFSIFISAEGWSITRNTSFMEDKLHTIIITQKRKP